MPAFAVPQGSTIDQVRLEDFGGAIGFYVDDISFQVGATTPGVGSSPFDTFVLPGLLVGVPAILLLGILAAQVAVGAAWLPVIRRWLNRRV